MKKILILTVLLLIGNFSIASEVTILHTSDTHGHVAPFEYKGSKNIGGISRRATFINEIRQENKNVLLLDSGDFFQGSIYYRIFRGQLSAKLLPYLKYDAIALGNHEFDNGLTVLKRNIKKSKTQFLSANVHFTDSYLKKAVKPYIIKTIDNEKYLIIGVTTSDLANLSDTKQVTVTKASDEIKNIITTVKYDKLIILSHCGLDEDRQIAHTIPEIDLILGGHNHYFFEVPQYSNRTPIIQDGEFGVRVGIIKFNNNLKHYKYQNITSQIQSNTNIDKQIAIANNRIKNYTSNIVAKTNITLIGEQNIIEHCQTNLGKIVLMSMVRNFPDYDAVMTNSGSIRINRNLIGNITLADVLEILPFDNEIVEVEILGKNLNQILNKGKQTNRRYLQYHIKSDYIAPNKTYKIVTNDYVASGKDGYDGFKNCKIIKKATKHPTTLLVEQLKEMKIITDNNIKF